MDAAHNTTHSHCLRHLLLGWLESSVSTCHLFSQPQRIPHWHLAIALRAVKKPVSVIFSKGCASHGGALSKVSSNKRRLLASLKSMLLAVLVHHFFFFLNQEKYRWVFPKILTLWLFPHQPALSQPSWWIRQGLSAHTLCLARHKKWRVMR